MSASSKGASREHIVKKRLEAEGWGVHRGAGSHGCADLWAAMNGIEASKPLPGLTLLKLIQVKGNKGSPYKNFPPSERKELLELAKQTGGEACLVHFPPNGQEQWISPDRWP